MEPDTSPPAHRVAIVTGAARGIGAATVAALAAGGEVTGVSDIFQAFQQPLGVVVQQLAPRRLGEQNHHLADDRGENHGSHAHRHLAELEVAQDQEIVDQPAQARRERSHHADAHRFDGAAHRNGEVRLGGIGRNHVWHISFSDWCEPDSRRGVIRIRP